MILIRQIHDDHIDDNQNCRHRDIPSSRSTKGIDRDDSSSDEIDEEWNHCMVIVKY